MSHFQMDPGWLEFHPAPSKPRFDPPRGAVDAHCHVFGPGDVFPYSAERKYTPCDAPKQKLWALRDHLGFSRNVIVQATCHGADNRALLDALQSSNGLARGVATVKSDVTDSELAFLYDGGVRGVRFNFVKRLVDVLPVAALKALAKRLEVFGLHIVIYFESQDLVELYPLFASLPGIVVVDHMGRPDVSKAVNSKEFDLFVRLMDENPNFWSKVSCPERLSILGPPDYRDVLPFSRRLIETFPERVLWGTDWPHPNMSSHMPDDGALVDLIPHIAPTQKLQKKLLVDNPLQLYWADQEESSHGVEKARLR